MTGSLELGSTPTQGLPVIHGEFLHGLTRSEDVPLCLMSSKCFLLETGENGLQLEFLQNRDQNFRFQPGGFN